MKRLFIILSILLGTASAMAQSQTEALSLSDYRLRVIDSSKMLKITQAKTDASESKFKMTRTGYYPSLTANAGANYFIGSPAGPNVTLKDYSYNANLTLQQTIYGGHAVANQTKAAAIDLDIARLNYEQTTENIIYSADVTYWALAASSKQLEIMYRYLGIVKNLYSIVSERFANGYISRTDLLMVETRLNEAKLQVISANKLYDNSMQNFNTLLSNDELIRYQTIDTLSAPLALPEFKGLDEALENRPDFKIAQRQIDLQNQNVRVARAKYNPQIVAGIQGVYGTLNPNMNNDRVGYGVAFLNISAPIFHFNERRHTVASVKAAVRAAEFAADNTRDVINQDLSNARINIEQTFEQTSIAELNLKIAQENLDLNTYSYAEGRLPILDVLSAQMAWIQSYTSAVNSNYQYRLSLSDYARALGILAKEM